ncbi:GNAT family N-acetyltransferase, partial [Klebsiella variicola subsp. variicola]|nr:GNAT family N-acetyltransferase [Klebsiella variicola subsp. variicola]
MTIITTQRLIIRHFKEEDAAALFDYLSSPRTPCFKDARIQIITATPMVHRREEANCRFWYAS